MNQKKAVAVITARGGSKRIPHKNIRKFCGKPMIEYSIEAALESGIFDEVMVSTDDEEIADIAKQAGAAVPFMRSSRNAGDFAATHEVVLEVLEEYNKAGIQFEYVCCIYPTAPFLTVENLQKSMENLEAGAADGVIPVVAYSFPPQRSFIIKDGKVEFKWPENRLKRSQDLETFYHDSGQFYFLRVSAFLREKMMLLKNTIPLILDEMEVQDIDHEEDWKIAEVKFQIRQMRKKSHGIPFSIVMCTYNSEATLKHAVDSVRNQKCQQWELIILDNGSQDATVQVLQEYQKKDHRITCIFREDNVGWRKGLSLCLKQSKGQYMMFLGADDYLASENTLEEILAEAVKHQPDIIWTACAFAELENGTYQIVSQTNPSYKVYEQEDKLTQLTELMQNVYYNSVMHYVNIDFLKKHRIDFYDPFYGDNAGMTEALCKADKMVVMDKIEYVLTMNTSQTALKTDFYHGITLQWTSIKKVLPDLKYCPKDKIGYIAERILRNISAMYENIVMGGDLRDNLMNPIERSLPERFLKAEEWISSDVFGEMMYYAGRQKNEEKLIGAAGVLYWTCKKCSSVIDEINENSTWLADFVEAAMHKNKDGNIVWRLKINKAEAEMLLKAIRHNANPHRIGCELLLAEYVEYDETDVKEKIKSVFDQYLEKMK